MSFTHSARKTIPMEPTACNENIGPGKYDADRELYAGHRTVDGPVIGRRRPLVANSMKMPEHIGPGCYHQEMDWVDDSPGAKGGRGAWGLTPRFKDKGVSFAPNSERCATNFVEKNSQVHGFTRRSKRHHRKAWRDEHQKRAGMAKQRAAAKVQKLAAKPLRSEMRVTNRRCRLWLTVLAVHTSCTIFKQIKLQGRAVKLMRLTHASNETLLEVIFTQWKMEFRIRRESQKDRRMRKYLLPLIIKMRIWKKRRLIALVKQFVEDANQREKLVRYTLYCTHYTLYSLHTVHTAHCTHCTLYTLHTVHTAHCTHYTLYTLHTVGIPCE
jgi:hypothetical protein